MATCWLVPLSLRNDTIASFGLKEGELFVAAIDSNPDPGAPFTVLPFCCYFLRPTHAVMPHSCQALTTSGRDVHVVRTTTRLADRLSFPEPENGFRISIKTNSDACRKLFQLAYNGTVSNEQTFSLRQTCRLGLWYE